MGWATGIEPATTWTTTKGSTTELRPPYASGRNRTYNLGFRTPLLYPLSYRGAPTLDTVAYFILFVMASAHIILFFAS
jgi:hypothetical protein